MKFSRTLTLGFALAATTLAGCTDAAKARRESYGDEANVTCSSGGQKNFEGRSTGKIERAESGSDGYYFRDKATGRLREVSGDCNIDFGATEGSSAAAATTTAQAKSIIRPAN